MKVQLRDQLEGHGGSTPRPGRRKGRSDAETRSKALDSKFYHLLHLNRGIVDHSHLRFQFFNSIVDHSHLRFQFFKSMSFIGIVASLTFSIKSTSLIGIVEGDIHHHALGQVEVARRR